MIAQIVTSKASWWNSLARPIRNQTRSTLIFIHPSLLRKNGTKKVWNVASASAAFTLEAANEGWQMEN